METITKGKGMVSLFMTDTILATLQQTVRQTVDASSSELLQLSSYLHQNPEIAFKEYKACDALCAIMEKHGFTVDKGCYDIPTAFKARYNSGKPGPRIGFLAEYDALPGVGHACGHNIIAATGVGAALAVQAIIGETGGEVLLIGTPGEEGDGGKVFMADRGAFDDIDFALMMHPTSGIPELGKPSTACCDTRVFFTGKSAHSSAPASGINALTAVLQTFNNIDKQRPLFALKDNINGIVTDGGDACNIIPGHAACAFTLRSLNLENLEKLIKILQDSVKAAEILTGATGRIEYGGKFAERYPNKTMIERFKFHAESMGEEMVYGDPNEMTGSSDIGNVSIRVPTIHEYISIAPKSVVGHSKEYAEAACSPKGDEACIKGAKALALTALDLLTDPDLRRRAQEEFEASIPASYKTLLKRSKED